MTLYKEYSGHVFSDFHLDCVQIPHHPEIVTAVEYWLWSENFLLTPRQVLSEAFLLDYTHPDSVHTMAGLIQWHGRYYRTKSAKIESKSLGEMWKEVVELFTDQNRIRVVNDHELRDALKI